MIKSDRANIKNKQNSDASFLSDRNDNSEGGKNDNFQHFVQNEEADIKPNNKSANSDEQGKNGIEIIESLVKYIAPDSLCSVRRFCVICDQWQQKEKIKQFDKCHHQFCQTCLKEYMLAKINSMQLIVCPEEGCGTNLTEQSQAYHELLTVQQKSKYNKVKLQIKTLSDPNLRLCKNESCSGTINLKEWKTQIKQNNLLPITCTSCKLEYCKDCYDQKHQGNCEKNIIKFLERNKKFRQCNVCKRVIQKSQGCTHMTCLCGNYFCYMCGEALSTIEIHQCIIPSELNCIQKIRWEVEHKEMFYESNLLSFHRCLYCLQLPGKTPGPLRFFYSLAYTLTVYPISIVLSLLLVAIFFLLILFLLVLLFLFLPLSEICTRKDYKITIFCNELLGQFCLGVIILLFYPVFVIAIMVESILEACKNDETWEQMNILFKEIGTGLRNVILMPFILCVNPESLDEAQESLNERIQNGV